MIEILSLINKAVEWHLLLWKELFATSTPNFHYDGRTKIFAQFTEAIKDPNTGSKDMVQFYIRRAVG